MTETIRLGSSLSLLPLLLCQHLCALLSCYAHYYGHDERPTVTMFTLSLMDLRETRTQGEKEGLYSLVVANVHYGTLSTIMSNST